MAMFPAFISVGGGGTTDLTEITATDITSGNDFSFTLPNVVVGSKLVIFLALQGAQSTTITSITTSDGTIELEMNGPTTATKNLIITPSAANVTLTGHKPNTANFATLKCYMIS